MSGEKRTTPPPRRLVTVTVASYADYDDDGDHTTSSVSVEPEPHIPSQLALPAAIGSLKAALGATIENYVEVAREALPSLDDEDAATITRAMGWHEDGNDAKHVEAAIKALTAKHADDPAWQESPWVASSLAETETEPVDHGPGFYL